MEQTNDRTFLETEPVGKLLLKLALPTVAAQLINMMYNIVDRMYIGHIPGDGAMALTGVGVCMPLIMVVSAFAALISNGGAPRATIFMGKGEKPSFTNKAYDGIYMQEGKKYLLSFYARPAEGTKEVRVSVRKDGKIAAETEILALQAGWNIYETVLTAKMDVKQADFVVSLEGEGTVCFDFFSLMPEDAVLHVFRRDLTERLKEVKPSFM